MNRTEILALFDGAKDQYVLEAVESRAGVRRGAPRKKLVLIAAAAAAALLLAGCAAVIAMTLQDRKVGELTYEQKFDAYGNTVPSTEKTLNIASMSGFSDSPTALAAREWLEFTKSYDPGPLTNDPDLPDIPNDYEYTYSCITPAMVEKVDELAAKYNLKLLGTRAVAQSWQQEAAFQELGLGELFPAEAPAEISVDACWVYPPYNFVCNATLNLTGADAPWKESVLADIYYLKDGYFMPDATFAYDPASCQEWSYTTAGGTQVQLALDGTRGFILTRTEDAAIAIDLDMYWQSVFMKEGMEMPSQAALERLADCFNYAITTQAVEADGLQAKFDAIPDPYSVPPEDWEPEKFGSFADYLNTNHGWPQTMQYAFCDIDGDGTDDLLTSRGDGYCYEWLRIQDGAVKNIIEALGPLRLCAGGIVDSWDVAFDIYHHYYKITGLDSMGYIDWEFDHGVSHYAGVWKIDDQECTEQEAQDLMASYKPLELNWRPLTEFPMDDQGTTFGDILEAEGTLSGEALKKFYAENYPTDHWAAKDFAWFSLWDVNQDGVDDLLLSIDGEKIDYLCTYNRGKLVGLGGDIYLCQGNVVENIHETQDMVNGIIEQHHFYRILGDAEADYYTLTHYTSQNLWKTRGSVISEEEAQATLGKYAHIDPGFRPIGELTGK